jgi:uncharacterized protein YyaL (SSP411 family)
MIKLSLLYIIIPGVTLIVILNLFNLLFEDHALTNLKNNLAHETSPYLLQHADNPVNWYPWGEEALQKARDEDKPILLSIGYSACHWCHVMEHESFEDPGIAQIMNDLFVCIKVDREERPDIDQIYMNYVQMSTGSGGWPLNVFLTPDLEPFYGGTYFPPEPRYGRPSWKQILQKVSDFYHNEKDALKKNVQAVKDAFKQILDDQNPSDIPPADKLKTAAEDLEQLFDPQYGGLGSAPKFPAIQPLYFLLHYYKRSGQEKYLHIVSHSLQKMAEGGIYDQIGGGFARYSVDEKWLVPHFEKMLYDNAQLVPLYLDTYLINRNPLFLNIVRETLNFIMREMYSPEGGFYSSLDADSEGTEGKFYLWQKSEIDQILGTDSELFCAYYNVSSAGNFEGKNILHIQIPLTELAARFGLNEKETAEILERCEKKLLGQRELRIRPATDDKILTSWNALMLSAFARAYQTLRDEKYKQIIEKNISFIRDNLYRNKRLLRTYNKGKSQIDGYLDDYAFLIRALLDAYEAVFDISYLNWAIELTEIANQEFWDGENDGYFYTQSDRSDLFFRLKDEHDQSVPSASAVMLHNNLRLYSVTENDTLIQLGEKILQKYGNQMAGNPYGYASYLIGLDWYLTKPKEVLLLYSGKNIEHEYLTAIYNHFEPTKVVVVKLYDQEADVLSATLFAGKKLLNNQTTAYICHNFACSPPVTGIDQFKKLFTR